MDEEQRQEQQHQWLDGWEGELLVIYQPGLCRAGHTWSHIARMLKWGDLLSGKRGLNEVRLNFSQSMFRAAVLGHNLDQVFAYDGKIRDQAGKVLPEKLQVTCLSELLSSPFNAAEQLAIAQAVGSHSKRFDEPGDSALSQALRAADKYDRMGTICLLDAGSHNNNLQAYDRTNPWFSTGSPASQYTKLLNVVEWVWMLPSDDLRSMAPQGGIRQLIRCIREIGQVIAEDLEVNNKAEDDLRKALTDPRNGRDYYISLAVNNAGQWWKV
jgi:hypothetical protein